MRSEKEMNSLILGVAKGDSRVLAVVLGGSRADPGSRGDILQDFDIVFVVKETGPFLADHSWVDVFGKRMIMQMPEAMGSPPPRSDGSFSYLMQFQDGNRIDLTLVPLGLLSSWKWDSLSIPLLDKDGSLGRLPPPSLRDHLPRPPSLDQFSDCCNEFWWVCPYVAKGLWRGKLIYAKRTMDGPVREQLMTMLTWYAGVKTGFKENLGKEGKFLEGFLESPIWEKLLETYSQATWDETWTSLFAMTGLFREISGGVSRHFGFPYPIQEDVQVTAFLEHLRVLPQSALDVWGNGTPPGG